MILCGNQYKWLQIKNTVSTVSTRICCQGKIYTNNYNNSGAYLIIGLSDFENAIKRMDGANRLTVGDMYLLACLLCLPLVAYGSAVPPRQPKLIWEDNFDNLDEGRWHHLVSAWGGGNEEFQYYRNVRKNRQVGCTCRFLIFFNLVFLVGSTMAV